MRFTNNPYEGFMKEKATLRVCRPACRRRAPVVTAALTGAGSAACSATGSSSNHRATGGDTVGRELTRTEKATIRRLVSKWCANYDRDCGCLPLDCECYMFGKCWTGAYCRYFREQFCPLIRRWRLRCWQRVKAGFQGLPGMRQSRGS